MGYKSKYVMSKKEVDKNFERIYDTTKLKVGESVFVRNFNSVHIFEYIVSEIHNSNNIECIGAFPNVSIVRDGEFYVKR